MNHLYNKFNFNSFFNGISGFLFIDEKPVLIYWEKELEIYVIEGKNIIHVSSIADYEMSRIEEQVISEFRNKYYKLQ
jgi:hypothetical protein